MATYYRRRGNWANSILYWKKLWEIRQPQSNPDKKYWVVKELIETYQRMDKDNLATPYFIYFLENNYEKDPKSSKRILVLATQSHTYKEKENRLLKALKAAKTLKKEEDQLLFLETLREVCDNAVEYYQPDNPGMAERYVLKRLGYAQQTEDTNIVCHTLWDTADFYQNTKKDYITAIDYYQQALKLVSNTSSQYIRIYNRLKVIYIQQLQFGKATDAYLKIMEQSLYSYDILQFLEGIFLSDKPQKIMYVKQILRELQQAEQKAQDYRDMRSFVIYWGIGRMFQQIKEYNKGANYLEKALPFAPGDETDDSAYGKVAVLSDIGFLYQLAEENTKAEAYFQQALQIRKEEGNRAKIAFQINKKGYLYQTQKKYTEAERYYNNALRTLEYYNNPQSVIEQLYRMAGFLLKYTSQKDKALSLAKRSLELSRTLQYDADVYMAKSKKLIRKIKEQ